ncbi:hypothetical protein GCM10009682_60500 [Luedemannella flava]|uniref:Secreted protein n=1 Tax=Luedemannella flava TaxID=349316 RepID=A0ABP4YXG1_9ACTN
MDHGVTVRRVPGWVIALTAALGVVATLAAAAGGASVAVLTTPREVVWATPAAADIPPWFAVTLPCDARNVLHREMAGRAGPSSRLFLKFTTSETCLRPFLTRLDPNRSVAPVPTRLQGGFPYLQDAINGGPDWELRDDTYYDVYAGALSAGDRALVVVDRTYGDMAVVTEATVYMVVDLL